MERGPTALFGAIVAVGLGPALWLGVQLATVGTPASGTPPTTIRQELPAAVTDSGGHGAGEASETADPITDRTVPPQGEKPAKRPAPRPPAGPSPSPSPPAGPSPSPSGTVSSAPTGTPPTESSTEPSAEPSDRETEPSTPPTGDDGPPSAEPSETW
ncbi:hypothetical protein GCM10010168_15950 [Actinoplanes ianthinogenes]|uniref:Uncharacterized protein n=1 Tax=Actinoplanes ianthinogenes TaxID=122358 RepID=A0ABM7LZM8_9ACTN|nr:hypothetical protein [Actinoplanes ianthinogenes]BCJ44782.1 hypothetical protein Aiant_54390 [Actinoplanes ianthinogenes]GGQ99946.1 hypothetical protein GCM10010168_15950 [Actinoplanes ianthinogenes]